MSVELVREQLIGAGLHQESVNRLLRHYQDMRFHLSNGKYEEAGAHIGNFCENLANAILSDTDEGVQNHLSVGTFIDTIESNNYDGTANLDYEIRISIPRAMRVAYDMRNNRDSVHINLEVPVNHSDTQTAVRLCTWMLAELLRIYGDEDEVDQIAELIEELSQPLNPYIDSYNGKRVIMSRELDVEQELLVHLHAIGREVEADKLTEWILGADGHTVKSKLGNMKQARKVHYDEGMAKITSIGSEEAESIIEEHFDEGIPEVSRREQEQVS
ncbi:hypothetical protein [Haloglomus litoreum]|uniref:hypothetical protein n=1 Tax=Haloglomus litoreum TaxID=3034026 RepID=UPI0023E8AC30|nr:hypothetical protein [Haloglomus sp. DT116]